MKRLVNLFTAIVLSVTLSVTTFAQSYTDEMSVPTNNKYINYYNLIIPHISANIGNDKDYLVPVSKGSLPCGVVYNVAGASSATFSIYSIKGTFATVRPDGSYGLGGSSGNPMRANYDPSSDTVYINQNGSNKVLTFDGMNTGKILFLNSEYLPSAKTLNLGVNIFASKDGQNYKPISSNLTSVEYFKGNQSGMYYETYTANIPSDTEYIRLAAYDFASLPSNEPDSPRIPNRLQLSLCLAQVTINGKDLNWGNKPPDKPEPPPDKPDPPPDKPDPPPDKPEPPPDKPEPDNPDIPDIPNIDGNEPPTPSTPEPDNDNNSDDTPDNNNHYTIFGTGETSVLGLFQKEFFNKKEETSSSSTHKKSSSNSNNSSSKPSLDTTQNDDATFSEPSQIIDPTQNNASDPYSIMLGISSGVYIGIGLLVLTIIAIIRRS